MRGTLALVLHAHLPYVRHPEHKHSLEESWLYQAVAGCYLPLLDLLGRLVDEEVPVRITLSLSPTLVAMLCDPLLVARCGAYLVELCELGDREVRRTAKEAALLPLAHLHRRRFRAARAQFEALNGDLIGGFRALVQAGAIELITTSATHAYLPILSPPEAVRAQVAVGLAAHHGAFGAVATGFWLPECGYTPGLESLLAEQGIRYSFLEACGIARASPAPRFGGAAPLLTQAGVAFFGRDAEASAEVWDAERGFPGHPVYLDFYRDIGFDLPAAAIGEALRPAGAPGFTGFKYYRVTGVPQKKIYDPVIAKYQVEAHAREFLARRVEQCQALTTATSQAPVITVPFDAELFGHWWFEGPQFLEALLRLAAGSCAVALRTPGDVLRDSPILEVGSPVTSSWGRGGFGQTWLNPETDELVGAVTTAGENFVTALAVGSVGGRALRQAARELLLAQASDWPFIVTAGTFADYARARVADHLAALDALLAGADSSLSLEREQRYPIFPVLDLNAFR